MSPRLRRGGPYGRGASSGGTNVLPAGLVDGVFTFVGDGATSCGVVNAGGVTSPLVNPAGCVVPTRTTAAY